MKRMTILFILMSLLLPGEEGKLNVRMLVELGVPTQ